MSSTEKLKAAFVETLGISKDTDFENLKYRGIEEWDSVAHMQLVNEIETAFDIMLSTDDVIGMSSFNIAKEIIAKYGISFDA